MKMPYCSGRRARAFSVSPVDSRPAKTLEVTDRTERMSARYHKGLGSSTKVSRKLVVDLVSAPASGTKGARLPGGGDTTVKHPLRGASAAVTLQRPRFEQPAAKREVVGCSTRSPAQTRAMEAPRRVKRQLLLREGPAREANKET